MSAAEVVKALGRWFRGPLHCHLCLAPVSRGRICRVCHDDMPLSGPACPRCGARLGGGVSRECGRCLRRPPAYHGVVSPLDYLFPVDSLILALKFQADLVAGRLLGELLAEYLLQSDSVRPQAVVPIPLHPRRLRKRGYNQASEIAFWVSRRLQLPLMDTVLLRRGAGPPQSTLAATARRANVRGAFRVSDSAGILPASVALVDDVLTTGATAEAAARALLAGGVERVTVWTVARSIKRGRF